MKFHRTIFRLANERAAHAVVEGLANDFAIDDDNWVQITPLGDFPHPKGLQRVDATAVKEMANTFNTGMAALKNRFIGLPWYIGHPDIDRARYPNDASYGRIHKVEAREDGLYGQVSFNDEGKALTASKKYGYHSPVWDGELLGNERGTKIIRPFKLISVGFTNQPNIPVRPLANEDTQLDETHVLMANAFIDGAIEDGVLAEDEREAWLGHFRTDARTAMKALANAGTSEGAKKGWETRRGNMAMKDPAKVAAKVAAKTARAKKTKLTRSQEALAHGKDGARRKITPTPARSMEAMKADIAQGAAKQDADRAAFRQKTGSSTRTTAEDERQMAARVAARSAKPPPLPKTAATPPPLPKAAASKPSMAARVAATASKLFRRS